MRPWPFKLTSDSTKVVPTLIRLETVKLLTGNESAEPEIKVAAVVKVHWTMNPNGAMTSVAATLS
jgi:hypothetical protein